MDKQLVQITDLVKDYADIIDELREENKALREKRVELETIINETLRALPVGSIPRHTPESIPERVQDWVKEAAEECRLREKWEELADRLISFAEIVREVEGNDVRNPHYYDSACKAIKEYIELKDGN